MRSSQDDAFVIAYNFTYNFILKGYLVFTCVPRNLPEDFSLWVYLLHQLKMISRAAVHDVFYFRYCLRIGMKKILDDDLGTVAFDLSLHFLHNVNVYYLEEAILEEKSLGKESVRKWKESNDNKKKLTISASRSIKPLSFSSGAIVAIFFNFII